mgnify:CR=1 FL=1
MKSILLNQLEERNRLLNQQYVERINDYDIQSLLHNPTAWIYNINSNERVALYAYIM